MSETGVVKFRCEQVAADLAPFSGLEELNACRRKLQQLRMIGVDANGIGYGNLSVRAAETNEFYITGSGTSALPRLSLDDYARVTAYDFEKNWLQCVGRAVASSESLTHAAVYESQPHARAVIHCHDEAVWAQLIDRGAATSRDVEYGTPEMAFEVQRLLRERTARTPRIFAMAGHVDGVVAFGHNAEEAFETLIQHRAHARSS